jgi:hypothetical protein
LKASIRINVEEQGWPTCAPRSIFCSPIFSQNSVIFRYFGMF